MAKGRFVSKSIATNEQLAAVSFTADYFFQRCIPHLDVEGRLAGNPLIIKAAVAPLRDEITQANIPELIAELAAAVDHEGTPLVIWYEVNGVKVLEFPGFQGQQEGLRKDREAQSRLPARTEAATVLSGSRPTPEPVRTPSGKTPQKRGAGPAQVKRSEVKRSKEKRRPAANAADSEPEGNRETWITPFADAWRTQYGGDMPIKPATRPLKALVDEWGADETRRRWAIYLAATDGAYANPARFASTFGEWNKAKVRSGTSSHGAPALAQAEVLWLRYKEHGLTRRLPMAEFRRIGSELSKAGQYPDIETFLAELRVTQPWTLSDAKTDRWAVEQIAVRLAPPAPQAVAS